ncbi:MAG: cytochrome P450 [Phormidesmis sp.]
MSQIPTGLGLDSTLALALDGYEFISKRCQRYQSDIFQTRLVLEKTICFQGVEAAKVFYDTDKFTRQKSAPKRVQKTLFGEGGVQGLDGPAHRHRKQMFMSLMSSKRLADLAELTHEQWQAAAKKWASMAQVTVFPAAREVLCRAVCAWAGVPLPESEVDLRTKDLGAMIDGSGAVGPQHWQGRRSRQRTEAWIKGLVEQVRDGQLQVPEEGAFSVIALHRDLEGNLLDSQIAAVEIINVLRPTVAIARYATFAALALHEHPKYQQNIKNGDDEYITLFVQEVRRYYPFFPFAAARVKQPFDWQGYHFPAGRRVLLDLYGTNHDARLWENPETFHPERFRNWNESRFSLIPQGGGDFYLNHRCPGEWITIELVKVTLKFLTRSITYNVPPQDLAFSLSQMPARPKSGFVISNVKIS